MTEDGKTDQDREFSHSHITNADQPAFSRASALRASRMTVASNFSFQKSTRVAGVAARLQPGCRCQKQPLISITFLRLWKTISGRPGSPFACRRYRYPCRWRSCRIRSSGPVFFPFIAAMFRRRELLVSAKSGRTDRGIRTCPANALCRPHTATSHAVPKRRRVDGRSGRRRPLLGCRLFQ